MKFAIRDDDTSFFTQPEQLLRVYEGIWDRAPVSLSVVPFHGRTPSGGIPPEYGPVAMNCIRWQTIVN